MSVFNDLALSPHEKGPVMMPKKNGSFILPTKYPLLHPGSFHKACAGSEVKATAKIALSLLGFQSHCVAVSVAEWMRSA